MSWCIYKHTSPTGKSYIGLANGNPEIRWKKGEGYKSQPLFYLAIKLYGWDNLKHEILEANISTQQEANKKEKYYIEYYNSYLNGYNMRAQTGGNMCFNARTIIESPSELLEFINSYYYFNRMTHQQPYIYPAIEEIIAEFKLSSGEELDFLLEEAYQNYYNTTEPN